MRNSSSSSRAPAPGASLRFKEPCLLVATFDQPGSEEGSWLSYDLNVMKTQTYDETIAKLRALDALLAPLRIRNSSDRLAQYVRDIEKLAESVKTATQDENPMPKIVDHEKRRAELAEAAWRTIARYGIEQTTTRTVAKEAGCSTGSIAHYFKGKKALLRAALRHSYVESDAALREHEANPGIEAIREHLLTALPTNTERRERWALWLAFAGRFAADPKTFEELTSRYDAWREAVMRSLVEAKSRGELPPHLDPKSEAQVLIAFVDGLGRQAALEPKRWPRKLVLEAVDRYLSRLSLELRRAA